jgi:hypothetical protein
VGSGRCAGCAAEEAGSSSRPPTPPTPPAPPPPSPGDRADRQGARAGRGQVAEAHPVGWGVGGAGASTQGGGGACGGSQGVGEAGRDAQWRLKSTTLASQLIQHPSPTSTSPRPPPPRHRQPQGRRRRAGCQGGAADGGAARETALAVAFLLGSGQTGWGRAAGACAQLRLPVPLPPRLPKPFRHPRRPPPQGLLHAP